MKVSIDETICAAHGDCVIDAPEVFDLGNDDDVARVIIPEPGPELFDRVRDAALGCPAGAIRVES